MSAQFLPDDDPGNVRRVSEALARNSRSEDFYIHQSAGFSDCCDKCGSDLRQLRCAEPECKGCVRHLENETCSHIFAHGLCGIDAAGKLRDAQRLARFAAHCLNGRADKQEAQAGSGGRVKHETTVFSVRCSAPDRNTSLQRRDGGQPPAKFNNSHSDSPSDSREAGTVPPHPRQSRS